MKRRTRARGWLRAALLRGLLLVVALVFCEAPVGFAPAQAAPAVTMASAGEAVLTKKKKRKKKKKKRKKKKKKRKKKKKKKKADVAPPTPAGTRVAVLPFEEEGGGLAMASQVLLGVTSVEHANSNDVQASLDSADPWSEASVRASLGANQATAVVRGVGRKTGGFCEVRVYAYSADGLVHFSEIYTTAPGDVDCLALAPQISDDLDRSLPNLSDLSVVGGPESWTASSASSGLPPPSPGTTGSSTSTGSSGGGEVEKKVDKKKDESASPMVSLGVALDTLYWSYDLESSALVNTVYWHPLEPYLGAAAMASLWPVEFVGVDLRLDFGMHSYVNIGEIDQERIDITALAVDAAVKGRYLADFGLGVGAHLGYRYVGTFVSEQTPITVAPSVGSHLLSPGLDLYVTALQPWLSVHLAGDVVPFGVYGESPDSPGAADSASLWGWHLEGSARSTFFMGIFAELSFFYENYYATYTGEGDRQNRAGTLVSDGRITNGMRGLALGVGWSY